MKVWRLSDPSDSRFARAGRVGGTWQEGEPWRRMQPLAITWLPGSSLVGDFTWAGLDTDIVVSERVGHALVAEGVPGFQLAPVEMVGTSTAPARGVREGRIKQPCVGPQLKDLWVTAWAEVDRARSTLRVRQTNASGGQEVFGVERWDSTWDERRSDVTKTHLARHPGQGLFVRIDEGIFRVREVPAWILCTDDVKRLVEGSGFTNVAFLEVGDTVDSPASAGR